MTGQLARKIILTAALALAVLGIARASLEKFDQQRQAIYAAAQAEQKRLGITNRTALGSQFPTPEFALGSGGAGSALACVVPGETAQIVVKGKFKPGTKFLLRSERIQILDEAATDTEYRATVKVPADIGPEDADLHAFTPVSAFHSAVDNAVVVTGRFEWHMNVSNDWRIIARLLEDTRCKSAGGSMKYQLDFFRGAETTPFEKRTATLYFDPYSSENYHFDIDEADQTGGAQAEMEKIAKRFQDPNLKLEEMEKLTARIEVLQKQMMEQYQKMADPAYQKQLEQKKQEFGCEDIYLKLAGAQFTGYMRCSEKVGTSLKITGTLKFLGR